MFQGYSKTFLLYIVFLHRKKLKKREKNDGGQLFDHITQWVNLTYFSFEQKKIVTFFNIAFFNHLSQIF